MITIMTLIQNVRNFSLTSFQIAAFCALFWLSSLLVSEAHWSIPGGVVGLFILIGLMMLKIVPERAVQLGSCWLLSELLLFFIPPVVSVLKYGVLIREDGGMIMATIVLGTVTVLVGTAWVVDRVFTLEQKRHQRLQLERL